MGEWLKTLSFPADSLSAYARCLENRQLDSNKLQGVREGGEGGLGIRSGNSIMMHCNLGR